MIKTFKFYMSNGQTLRKLINSRYYEKSCDILPISSEEEIDKVINEFLNDISGGWEVVDIKINDYTLSRHNNGGSDTIVRTYTIIMK